MSDAEGRVRSVWDEVQAERERAHAKHGGTSMESLPVDDLTRLTVLMEEVGEVARWFNENRHGRDLPNGELRAELIQVAAMAGAWADALTRRCCTEWPECSHVFAEYAEKHRAANPGCTCLTCMDAFEGDR